MNSIYRRYIKAVSSATIAILVTLSVAAAAFGQTTNNFVVKVLDPNGAPITGASVTISGRDILGRTVVTNSEGEAIFANVPNSVILIRTTASGFSQQVFNWNNDGSGTPATVNLATGPIVESVTVTAERTQVSTMDTAKPVSVLGKDAIEQRAANSVGDLFRTLPGASTVNEGAFQVRPRIRGLDSNRVLVLIDGERLNNARTSTSNSGIELGLVDISQVDSLEVVRGSGSVLYGTDALAGTVNIITKDTPPRRESGFRFGASLSTFFTSNESGRKGTLAVTGAGNLFSFRVAQSFDRFGNYFTGKADGSVPQQILNIGGIGNDGEVFNSQSHGSNTSAIGRFYLNEMSTLRLSYDRKRTANIGSPTLVGVFNGFFPFSDRDKFSGRYDIAGINKYLSRLSISAFYQTQDRNFTNILTVPPVPPFFPGQYQFSETITDTTTSGFDLQSDWSLGGRNFLTAGFSFFRDNNSDERTIISSTTPTSPNRTVNNSRSVPNADLTNYAAFAQNEFRMTPRFRVVAGVRIDRFATNSEPTEGFDIPATFTQEQIEDLGLTGLTAGLDIKNTAVTGDIGVVYSLTDEVSLSGRIGRSFRTPNIFERFFTDFGSTTGFVVGNPSLKPESGVNFDTSVRYQNSRFSASATYFNNYFTNFLSSTRAIDRNGQPISIPRNPPLSPIPVFQTQNISKARIQGVEIEFQAPIKIGLGYLTPNGNFSYLRGDNPDTGMPLNFISPFRTNAGLRWENFGKSYFFDYTARIVTKQERLSPDFLASNAGPEPGFVTHNISGGYYFRREKFDLNINLGVSNMFGRAYNEQFVFAPARGRSFTVGSTISIK